MQAGQRVLLRQHALATQLLPQSADLVWAASMLATISSVTAARRRSVIVGVTVSDCDDHGQRTIAHGLGTRSPSASRMRRASRAASVGLNDHGP